MARNCNENDNDNIDPASIVSNLKSSLKHDIIKDLLKNSFQDNKIKLGNDALTMVVEIAKCLVTETCLRASRHALRENSDKVQTEHIEKCLPQLAQRSPFVSEGPGYSSQPNSTQKRRSYLNMMLDFP